MKKGSIFRSGCFCFFFSSLDDTIGVIRAQCRRRWNRVIDEMDGDAAVGSNAANHMSYV